MNGNPSAAQSRWHKWLREFGCQLTGQPCPTIQHIQGARMRLKGVDGFAGEWYCYGLCFALHLGAHPNSLATSKPRFISAFGSEKSIWKKAVAAYEEENGKKPMPEHVYQTISDRA